MYLPSRSTYSNKREKIIWRTEIFFLPQNHLLPLKCLDYKHCTFQKSSNWEHPWTAAPIFLFFCFCGKTLAHYSSLLNALWWVWKVPFPIVQEYSIASPFFIISRFLFQKHTPFFEKLWSNNDYILKVLVEDMKEFRSFMVDKLTKIDHIGSTHSMFMINQVKHTTELPLFYD